MHKILIALLIIGFGTTHPVPPTQGHHLEEAPETTVSPIINNATPAQIELVNSAIRRFADQRLELPSLEITFSDTNETCQGFWGIYQPGAAPPNAPIDQITICDSSPITLFHELGHAWEHHSVTDHTRARFLRYWQLETWNDQSEEWDDRGIEKAAKTIAYTLAFDELPEDLNQRRYVCARYVAAFKLLTRNPLPNDLPANCALDTTPPPPPSATVALPSPQRGHVTKGIPT